MIENTNCSTPQRKWGWKEKLSAKMFPYEPCPLPEAPASFKDTLVIITRAETSILTRLKILLTGKFEVETRTVTENIVGETRVASQLRAGKWFK